MFNRVNVEMCVKNLRNKVSGICIYVMAILTSHNVFLYEHVFDFINETAQHLTLYFFICTHRGRYSQNFKNDCLIERVIRSFLIKIT